MVVSLIAGIFVEPVRWPVLSLYKSSVRSPSSPELWRWLRRDEDAAGRCPAAPVWIESVYRLSKTAFCILLPSAVLSRQK